MPPQSAQLEPDELEQMMGEESEGEASPAQLDPIADNPALQNIVRDLCKHFIGLDKWVRRSEVIDARRQRFYKRQDQYIYWKSDAVGFIPAIGGSAVDAGNNSVEVPRYTDVYDIYSPYGESIMATLTQNPPGIDWQPADARKGPDITAAEAAEKYQQTIEQNNQRKGLQSEISNLFYTDGRVVLEVETIDEDDDEDGAAWEEISAWGVLEAKVIPVTAKKQKEVIAIVLSREIDICQAKAENPDVAEQIVEGSTSLGESAYERIARLGVMQGTRLLMQAGDAFSHLVTRHKIYLRPSAIEKAPEPVRDHLRELYPDGIYVTFCGETYCGSRNRSPDNHLRIGFPTPGDGMSRPSLGKRMVPLQDVFNDEVNLWHEAHDYCIPTTFMFSSSGDIEAVREQSSQPGNIVPITDLPPGAQSMADAFFNSVLSAVPATLPAFVQFVQGPLAQFITGAFPALFGGDTHQNDTKGGIEIQRDQALGRMGIPWGAMQELFAGIYECAVRLAVERMGDDHSFTYQTKGRDGQIIGQEISAADLKQGSFKAVPDIDSGFPQTTSSKRAALQTLRAVSGKDPVIAAILAQPDNLRLEHEVNGIPEIYIPQEMAGNKQLGEIDQLLQEAPIEPPMQVIQQLVTQQAEQGNTQLLQAMTAWEKQAELARVNNKPAPPKPLPPELLKPSIGIEPEDFHQYEYAEAQDWLSSPACRSQLGKGNFPGVLNVRLHARLHKDELDKLQAEQSPGKGAAGALSSLMEDGAQAAENLKVIAAIPPQVAIAGKALPAVVSAGKELVDASIKGVTAK